MQKKQVLFTPRGMNRDLSESKFSPEFAYENMNIRITTLDDNTLLTLNNEKGNASFTPQVVGDNPTVPKDRVILGYAVVKDIIVLFSTGAIEGVKTDCISKIIYINTPGFTGYREVYMFHGDLNFNINNPIETLPLYEAEDIQKVYWVDGINQPRVINIAKHIDDTDNTQFDFLVSLNPNGGLTIARTENSSGQFPGGTVQYCVTYSNRNGQESKIAHTSQVLYTTFENRAVSPNESSNNSFWIRVNIVDMKFDYINLYSIVRTSEGGQPIVKLVAKLETADSVALPGSTNRFIEFTDTNTTGEIVDSTKLLYIGGQELIAGTIASKDNTLFLGNITTKENKLPSSVKSLVESDITLTAIDSTVDQGWPKSTGYVEYRNPLIYSSHQTYFRRGNTYRLGVQFMSNKGVWSEPAFIDDFEQTKYPKLLGSNLTIPGVQAQFSNSLTNAAIAAGYIKARLLVVYPEPWERGIIAQGIVCPTVFRGKDRRDNAPYAQSSWFFRPYYSSLGDEKHSVEYRHAMSLGRSDQYNSEIQYMDEDQHYCTTGVESDRDAFLDSNNYYIDGSILTFHSPDINNLSSDANISGSNLRIVGAFSVDSAAGRVALDTSELHEGQPTTVGINYDAYPEDLGVRNLDNTIGVTSTRGILSTESYGHVIRYIYNVGSETELDAYTAVYPWNRNTTLFIKPSGRDKVPFNTKVISNIRSSQSFFYYDDTDISNFELSNRRIFKQSFGDNALSLDTPSGFDLSYGAPLYSGNCDKIIIPEDYNVYGAPTYDDTLTTTETTAISGDPTSKDAVPIQYISTDHAVLQLDGVDKILPTPNSCSTYKPTYPAGKPTPFWLSLSSTPESKVLKSIPVGAITQTEEIMWITELYREIPSNIFGGRSEYALKNNKWVACSLAAPLVSSSTTVLIQNEGDTIFNRWDCVKTLPRSTEDKNQIVEIMSFMCESYVNTAGRYDKHRDELDYTYLNASTEFNAINDAYNNKDDYFVYRILNTDTSSNYRFPSQVTWSLTKTLGESIDTWTSISLASILDLDGNKGEVRALRTFKNDILAFQDKGISQIIYNPSGAIATSTGIPIELANSGKVEGKRYITESIGCTNKWSICVTQNGVYFIDSLNKKIYLLSDSIQCLSTKYGFDSWLRNELAETPNWNGAKFGDMIIQYDKNVNDVYFISSSKCLAFNETLGTFTSFYDYDNAPFFININGKCFSVHNANIGTLSDPDNSDILWEQHAGGYCEFFNYAPGGQYHYNNYYTEIIVNDNPTSDKIFTNLDFRADSYRWENNFWTLKHALTFNHVDVDTEYQHGDCAINFVPDTPASLKKKFRIWRVQLPRNNNSRDRIRNPWAHIRLSRLNPSGEKTQLHDMVVTYYI